MSASESNTGLIYIESERTPRSALSFRTAVHVRAKEQVRDELAHSSKSTWVLASRKALKYLLAGLTGLPTNPRSWDLALLALESIPDLVREELQVYFRVIVDRKGGLSLLPREELEEVLEEPNKADLVIGGKPVTTGLLLYRGNLEPLIVPRNWFHAAPGHAKPDFSKFSVADYGQTVRLGNYEASTDAILYEFDADYRSRAKRRMREQDTSFGGSIRRLRLDRRLTQKDFSPLSDKQIARIEKGESRKPQTKTLMILAEKLGVPVEKLGTY